MKTTNSMKIRAALSLFLILFAVMAGGCSKSKKGPYNSLLPMLAGGNRVFNGVTQWVKSVAAAPSDSYFYSVAAGSDGIYAAGIIIGDPSEYEFGNDKSITVDNEAGNIVLAKYDTSGNAQWIKSVTTGPSDSYFNSVAAGSDGIYAAGSISGNPSAYDLGNGKTITVNNSNDNLFLAKYDTNGNTQWVKSVNGPDSSEFYSVAAGSDGIYAAGLIIGNALAYDFGNGKTITINNDKTNIVLVKYDTNGNTQWVKSVTTGPSDSYFTSVAVGADGIYAAGSISGNALAYDFGNGKTITVNNPDDNVVLVKYDTSGNAQWVRSANGPASSAFNSVAAGGDGIYAAGFVFGDASAYDFGNGKTITVNNSNENIVLVKYDTSGNAQWIKSMTAGPGDSYLSSVAAGRDGIYAAGSISGNPSAYDFGSGKTITVNNSMGNIVLVKFDTSGNTQWIESFASGPDNSEFSSVAVGNDGIYSAGYLTGTSSEYESDDGKTVTVDNSNDNIMLVKYQ